jgi:hypothetical protein
LGFSHSEANSSQQRKTASMAILLNHELKACDHSTDIQTTDYSAAK